MFVSESVADYTIFKHTVELPMEIASSLNTNETIKKFHSILTRVAAIFAGVCIYVVLIDAARSDGPIGVAVMVKAALIAVIANTGLFLATTDIGRRFCIPTLFLLIPAFTAAPFAALYFHEAFAFAVFITACIATYNLWEHD